MCGKGKPTRRGKKRTHEWQGCEQGREERRYFEKRRARDSRRRSLVITSTRQQAAASSSKRNGRAALIRSREASLSGNEHLRNRKDLFFDSKVRHQLASSEGKRKTSWGDDGVLRTLYRGKKGGGEERQSVGHQSAMRSYTLTRVTQKMG